MADETDFSHLEEDLTPDDMRVVLGVFAADAQRLLRALNAASADGDVVAFKRVAHGLAGAAGAVGAKTLEQTCRAAMTRTDFDVDSLRATQAAIVARANTAMERLARFVAGLDAAPDAG